MGKHTEVSTSSSGEKFVASKADSDHSTELYHGYSNGEHTTYHNDGSAWKTESDGTKHEVESSGSGDSGK